jgi:hypothetical protein
VSKSLSTAQESALQSSDELENTLKNETESDEETLNLDVDLDDEERELLDLAVLLDLVEGVGSVLEGIHFSIGPLISTLKNKSYVNDVRGGLSNSLIVLLPHDQTTALQAVELGVGSVESIREVVNERLNGLISVLIVVNKSGYMFLSA